MACRGQGQPCIWFSLENVEYDEPNCQLDSSIHEIKLVIKGQRKTGRGNLHSYDLVLSEQGRPFCLEIAQRTGNYHSAGRSVAYHRGKYKKSGSIKSDETLDVIFLVKKANTCPNGPHKIDITCTLRHMHTGLNTWCSSTHAVSLILIAV